ncbi:MAG: grasp-with-spasm system SPASM domain peptide maturase [Bacteroidota bacterium]|nr:grasp-with-spasm system SPASM domain peptide maturase [Bacteroidota bacterium]
MHTQNPNKHLKLFACCLLVKGTKRSLICDVQRNEYKFIPNDLYEILLKYDGMTLEFIKSNFDNNEAETIDKYVDFLEKSEFIFLCDKDEVELFPLLNLDWDMPSLITNVIIELNEFSSHDFFNLFNQLEKLNCRDIQIVSYTDKSIFFWTECLLMIKASKIKNIEIINKWNNSFKLKDIIYLTKSHLRLRSIIFHSSPKFEIIQLETKLSGSIFKIFDQIESNYHCGQIHWNYFNTNIKLFTEAQKHNTCLNRKISIDVNGEIKNCPSMAKSFGNIKDTTLAEAIEKPGFKDMWYINKDQIAVCKDCEFRYICTDCRAYIENPEDVYSKPLKCGYNPYTAEWEEWSTNPLKQKAIEYYGMQELVKKDTP